MTEMASRSRIRTIDFRTFTLLVAVAAAVVATLMMSVPAWAASKVFVTDVSPDGNATSVAADSNITATFSKDMRASTIKGTTFYLKKQGSSTTIPAHVSYSGTSKTATLNPDSNLEAGATYTAYIKGGRRGVKASNGDSLGGTADSTATFANGKVTWSFTVANDTPPPGTPLTVKSFDPADGATDVDVASNVKVTFSQDVDMNHAGAIPNPVNIYDANNLFVDATTTFDGHATFTLNPTKDFKGGATYKVETNSNAVWDKAGNQYQGRDSASFTTKTDTTPPSITSSTPADGATNVPVDIKISVTYSESIDPSSVASKPIVATINGGEVSGTSRFDGNKTITFTPDWHLPYSSVVNVALAPVKDLTGNDSGPLTYSFSVAANPNPTTDSLVFDANPTSFHTVLASFPTFCTQDSKWVNVINNTDHDITIAGETFSKSGYSDGVGWYLAHTSPSITIAAGDYIQNQVTFVGNDRNKNWTATLQYKDQDGNPISGTLSLNGTTECAPLVVG